MIRPITMPSAPSAPSADAARPRALYQDAHVSQVTAHLAKVFVYRPSGFSFSQLTLCWWTPWGSNPGGPDVAESEPRSRCSGPIVTLAAVRRRLL